MTLIIVLCFFSVVWSTGYALGVCFTGKQIDKPENTSRQINIELVNDFLWFLPANDL